MIFTPRTAIPQLAGSLGCWSAAHLGTEVAQPCNHRDEQARFDQRQAFVKESADGGDHDLAIEHGDPSQGDAEPGAV